VQPLTARLETMGANPVPPAVVFDNVSFAFDEHVILRDLSFSLPTGSMKMLLGASGAGKSVVLKLILGLLRLDAGRDSRPWSARRSDDRADLLGLRGDIGTLFQESALFDSLTVAENVGYRLYEETDMPEDRVRSRIREVLGFIGLGEYVDRMPSELSGGQQRRVAIAVTHQIRDAFYKTTHEAVRRDGHAQILAANEAKANEVEFMVLHEGRIYFEDTAAALGASRDRNHDAPLNGRGVCASSTCDTARSSSSTQSERRLQCRGPFLRTPGSTDAMRP
jgi:phospholipid/cholesterol/gamma-HCH transport system ATP-binding protein